MIQSMTGFAERTFASKKLQVKITVKSLNHRFFDWTYKGAPIGNLENRLRGICQRTFHRGRLEVFVELGFPDPSSWDVTINEGLLEKLLLAMQKIPRRLGAKLDISADTIFRLPQVVELRRKELGHGEALFLQDCFEQTLDDVRRARLKEGKEIEKEIRRHIRTIGRSVKRMELLIRNQPVLIRERLKQRLKGLSQETDQSEERLAEESAYLAQRYDLAEEIVRLRSHLRALGELVSLGREGPAGKQLDFFAQELYREANTTNSKSQDIEIIKESLTIKGEVESIRQHIQNIE